jgi:uncharacterized alpha-E superfamily protein
MLREDRSLRYQHKKLLKKLAKIEKEYDDSGPIKQKRLEKKATSILEKLEAIKEFL